MRRLSLACAFILALCTGQRVLAAQTAVPSQPAVLSGTVTNALGEPLQYAIVSIASLDRQLFSNSQGAFNFTGIQPGKYVVRVRQLGYVAAAVEVTVGADERRQISVKLERIVTKLASMQVLADWPCDKPGRPVNAAQSDIMEVFEQLEQNAVRMRLLSTQFPFDVVTERIRSLRHGDGLLTVESHDSVRAPNQQTARYRPGEVVQEREVSPKKREKFMQLPTLLDFADPLFQANHCFLLRGVEQTASGKEIRVDFKPSGKLKTPDVAGSVFLAADTYKLLRSDIEMTKIPKDLAGLARVTALTYFDDLVPGLPAVGEIVATTDLKAASRMSPVQSIERIITLKVFFRKEIPDGIARDSTSAERMFR